MFFKSIVAWGFIHYIDNIGATKGYTLKTKNNPSGIVLGQLKRTNCFLWEY